MTQIRPLVAGNWKMNGTRASWQEALNLAKRLAGSGGIATDVMLCPPATLLHTFASGLEGQKILVGAQNCHSEEKGAHTGELSAEMLADAGADAVIVGHSERRADNGETNPIVNAKARAAHRAGLTAIICIGETEDERKQGETLAIVGDQLSGSLPGEAGPGNTVIAYEPVWAIGTGLTPTLEDVAEVHGHIRTQLSGILGAERAAQVRILYGGSVKPDNAADLMGVEHVNGALVGGASLNASDFWGIISVYGQT